MSWPALGNDQGAQLNEWLNNVPTLPAIQLQSAKITSCEDAANHTICPVPIASGSQQTHLASTREHASPPWEYFDFPGAPISALEPVEEAICIEPLNQLTMDSLMAQAFSNPVTEENVSSTTTLCSWAFSLILKSNPKGYTAKDLDFRLRVRYRHGATPTEGCRIENKVLLNVLADIM
ncbi:hypothetical protein ACJQWK_06862 [Exserohilum turcicum]|uniref:Uncharacterized protein n=1 Tax=Exserohilum turcicum (strain 28A) TaxID=671987 RepID=R0IKH7_EXST2|nr:uncharacterized protein SETTUDRAFT_32592 [Exserohilum turcica Et28A]EOA85386.1 hypothetical protein SETTUDRAFT_32592 [Exserohilum turcica Et28A]